MRTLTRHQINPANDRLTIAVIDEPGPGGACHHYRVTGYTELPPQFGSGPECNEPRMDIIFQTGPIVEAGVNGITQEVLLEIVADRLRSFQAGPYACRENALALTKVDEALMWLHERTRARMARGVEGTSIK